MAVSKITRCQPRRRGLVQAFALRWQELVVFLFLVWVDVQILVFWFAEAMSSAAGISATAVILTWWQRLLVYLVWLLPPFIMMVQFLEQSIFWGKIIASVIGAASLLYLSCAVLLATQIGFEGCFLSLALAGFFFFIAVSMFYKFQCRCVRRPRR